MNTTLLNKIKQLLFIGLLFISSFSNAQNYICPGESYNLTAQAGLSNYQWYTISGTNPDTIAISGANNALYVATTAGTYFYRSTDANGCQVNLCIPIVLQNGNCCVKPNAGNNQTACQNSSKTLMGTIPTTGTWTSMIGNPSGATLGSTTGGVANVSFNGSALGTYNFIYNIGTSCEDTMSIIVNPSVTSTTNTTICSNQLPYLWNGAYRLNAGTYTFNTTNVSGCDSVATLLLSVNNTVTSTTNTTICSNQLPYLWNGAYRLNAGTYTFSTTNVSGCDSVATLVLAVNNTATSTTNITVCSNQMPYLWNGINRNSAGTYAFNTTNVSGCDSVATLLLSVNNTATSTTNTTICSNQLPYLWNGINRNSAGTYTFNTTNVSGCDSVATLLLLVNNTAASTTNTTICSNQLPYLWNGAYRLNAGTYTFNSTNVSGCDSVATLVLAVNNTSASTTNVTVCSNQMPYLWNGINRNSAGTYSFNTTNVSGCDSVATLVLTVPNSSTSSTSVSICATQLPYSWNGTNYNTSGVYTFNTTNSIGCDSVATLNLTVTNFGTIGNYLWNDKNNNGLQDELVSDAINGQKIYLYNNANPLLPIDSTITSNYLGNDGYYQFQVCTSGNYKVKFPTTIGSLILTTQTSTPATNGNSDGVISNGYSPVFSIDVNGTGIAKDNNTIDAGYHLATPTIVSYPNEQYCIGNNVVLKAYGNIGATFNWTTPIGFTGTIDNSVSGESTITILNFSIANNGNYLVTQTLGNNTSLANTIIVNGGAKPTINFVTTSCVSNTGQITINANPSTGLEFAVNGGIYQTSNVLTTPAGSTFVVAVKEQNTSCVVYYSGQCVNCNAQSACTNPAKDSLVAPEFACIGTPIALSNFITNASNVTLTSNGTGVLSTTSSNTLVTNFTYTPTSTDVANGGVIITATTNDPDGAGPCTSAVKSVLIQLANGLVEPTIITNSPICENSAMTFEAVGAIGNVTWLGANGYTSTNNPDSIINTPANMQGGLTVTLSAVGCSNVSANTNVFVIAAPNLTVNITPHNELCAGNGNGSIEVSVAGGSGNYTICYNSNLSNCVNGTYANFQYVAPGNYTVTVVDQACPNNTFSYLVTIGAGMVVAPPVVASTISSCSGSDLTLAGTTPNITDNINWTFAGNNFNALGNPVIRHNSTMAMNGIYFAKTIANNGCASLAVPVTVEINETPVINHVQVNCLLTSSKVEVTATLSAGTIMYSLDGITYQTSNIFNNFSGGNYTLYVKNSATNCIATQSVLIPNCACPNEPVVNIVHPLTSCGLTAIPITASFTNVTNATWTTAGTGAFTTTTGTTGFATNYTPSNTELVAGECNLTITTADPDGAGPCTPVSKLIKIKLVNSLQQPTITKNQASYCTGDTVVLMSNITDSVEWNGVGGFYSNQSNAIIENATQFLSGYYKVTANGNGCVSKMDSILITIATPPTLVVSTSSINETCEGKGNGEITVNVSGGTGNYIVCNDLGINCNSTIATHTFKYLAPATYAIHVSDASCPNYRVVTPTTVGAGMHVDTVLSASYNNPVCAGDDLVLTASTSLGSSVLWTDGNNNYSAFGNTITRSNSKSEMSGVYKVQRVENGCASTPKYLDVHVYDNPSIATFDTLCMGSIDSGRLVVHATIAPTDAIEYSINGGAFQSSNIFDNLSNGLFQVSARAVGSDCVTTLNEIELYCNCFCNRDAVIDVFPNPNEGAFAIHGALVVESSDITISVVDMGGRKVYETQLTSKAGVFNHSIDIRRYATGAYLLTLTIDGEKFVKPIMVNR